MPHRILGDVVMVTHFGYLVYLVVGGFLAWRWPQAIYYHLVAVGWALGIVFVGFSCPRSPVSSTGGDTRQERSGSSTAIWRRLFTPSNSRPFCA